MYPNTLYTLVTNSVNSGNMSESQPFIFTMPKGMRPAFPTDYFRPGDLVVSYKITKIQYDNIIKDLRKKEDQKIINSFPNELGET